MLFFLLASSIFNIASSSSARWYPQQFRTQFQCLDMHHQVSSGRCPVKLWSQRVVCWICIYQMRVERTQQTRFFVKFYVPVAFFGVHHWKILLVVQPGENLVDGSAVLVFSPYVLVKIFRIETQPNSLAAGRFLDVAQNRVDSVGRSCHRTNDAFSWHRVDFSLVGHDVHRTVLGGWMTGFASSISFTLYFSPGNLPILSKQSRLHPRIDGFSVPRLSWSLRL